MLRRILAVIGLVLFLGALGLGAAFVFRFEVLRWQQDLPAYTHRPGDERRARVEMRDGVGLATTIRLPAGGEQWPTLLIRNPYERFDRVARDLWCGIFVRYGYGCVYQDVRGQMGSEGEWDPFVNERPDGQDTLAWLVAQPFHDGNLALYGPSYLAAVQWAVADTLPAEVKTFIPTVVTTDLRRALYENGMFRHETFTAWAAMMRDGTMRRGAGEEYRAALQHRPHAEVDEKIFGMKLPWYQEWLRAGVATAPLWQREDYHALLATPAKTRVPVLMIGGWYDVFLGPQLDDFHALGSRSRSKLVVGPWTHVGEASGVLEFPDSEGGLAQWARVLDWLGHHLRGEPLEQGVGVETYVMGENRWASRAAWPPPTRPERLHLAAAESPNCAGTLAGRSPQREQDIRYRYDPFDPTPTVGGGGMLAFILPGFGGAAPANQWQPEPCHRTDVVSFLGEPLATPLHIAGSVKVALTVRSDVGDTAFHAKLSEVFPDGSAINVRDGVTSLSHRNGRGDAAYDPGDAVPLSIRMWPIEWVAKAGSRLRLDIASADFPKYHAHGNRVGAWAEISEPVPAEQTLLTGPGHEAYLALPVAEPGS